MFDLVVKVSIKELRSIIENTQYIPEWIKGVLTDAVLHVFATELKREFFKIDECDWKEAICHLDGTQGYGGAFERALTKCGLDSVWNYYDELEWYESDLFDGDIVDLLLEKNML